jgi:hypothetical protein
MTSGALLDIIPPLATTGDSRDKDWAIENVLID